MRRDASAERWLFGRAPDDERCLLVSTPNKALSQSFENLIDENNLGLMTVRASFLMSVVGDLTIRTSQTSRAGPVVPWQGSAGCHGSSESTH